MHYKQENERLMSRIGFDRWIELGFTGAILIATVVNVCVAYRQWTVMDESNRINTRPYIKVLMAPGTFVIHKAGDGARDSRSLQFVVQNIGRLPGLAAITSAVNWEGRGHPRDDKSWPSIGVVGRIFLFPDNNQGVVFSSQPLDLTKGQLTDLADGDKFFVMVDVLYGPSKNVELYGPSRDYETKVCTVYRLTGPAPGSDEIRLTGDGYPCPSEGSNYAK